jgi:DNA-binding response OmpR family regulator
MRRREFISLPENIHSSLIFDRVSRRENGAEALFTKPIDFGALRNEIDTCVERAA